MMTPKSYNDSLSDREGGIKSSFVGSSVRIGSSVVAWQVLVTYLLLVTWWLFNCPRVQLGLSQIFFDVFLMATL